MKHFMDYNPSKEEMIWMWSEYGVESALEDIAEDPDYEKASIALLLFERGQHEESRKVLETIEDENCRRTYLNEHYPLWCDTAKGYM